MSEKKGLKPLPLSLRGKKRYLTIGFLSDKPFSKRELEKAFWENYLELFGSHGAAKARIHLKEYSRTENQAIVRCSLQELENVKASVPFLREVSGKPVVPAILRVSGSVKKAGGKKKPKPRRKAGKV